MLDKCLVADTSPPGLGREGRGPRTRVTPTPTPSSRWGRGSGGRGTWSLRSCFPVAQATPPLGAVGSQRQRGDPALCHPGEDVVTVTGVSRQHFRGPAAKADTAPRPTLSGWSDPVPSCVSGQQDKELSYRKHRPRPQQGLTIHTGLKPWRAKGSQREQARRPRGAEVAWEGDTGPAPSSRKPHPASQGLQRPQRPAAGGPGRPCVCPQRGRWGGLFSTASPLEQTPRPGP